MYGNYFVPVIAASCCTNCQYNMGGDRYLSSHRLAMLYTSLHHNIPSNSWRPVVRSNNTPTAPAREKYNEYTCYYSCCVDIFLRKFTLRFKHTGYTAICTTPMAQHPPWLRHHYIRPFIERKVNNHTTPATYPHSFRGESKHKLPGHDLDEWVSTRSTVVKD